MEQGGTHAYLYLRECENHIDIYTSHFLRCHGILSGYHTQSKWRGYFRGAESAFDMGRTNVKHSIIHPPAEEIEVLSTLSNLASTYSDIFLRCHQSYLVNPNYIVNIRRFKITLSNGIELPVPEKKYTLIKSRIMDLLTSKHSFTVS